MHSRSLAKGIFLPPLSLFSLAYCRDALCDRFVTFLCAWPGPHKLIWGDNSLDVAPGAGCVVSRQEPHSWQETPRGDRAPRHLHPQAAGVDLLSQDPFLQEVLQDKPDQTSFVAPEEEARWRRWYSRFVAVLQERWLVGHTARLPGFPCSWAAAQAWAACVLPV